MMQPVTLDGKETLDDISFVISAVLPLFRFKEQKTQINQPIVQVPKYVFDTARQQYRSDRLLMVRANPETIKRRKVGSPM
ncbi:MAG TPA: hypothetical protein VFZ60_00795 [Nitrososphaeraceae archaeon]